jgi:hypothetical protein
MRACVMTRMKENDGDERERKRGEIPKINQ